MTILEAAGKLRAREVSARELTEEALARVAGLNPKLNAFITVLEERARAEARRADEELARGLDRGPLHGIPLAVKDVFSTRGVRTTCGSRLFAEHVPDRDAAVVEKLAAAGAVLVGKLGMHELAYGITSANPHFGAVRNPWDTDRIPGGSSGGSGAAVAAGLVFAGMGSDTGGSIRIPASFCGVTGLKPTSGRVSRYGVLPLDFSLDHMGPLARSARDAAVILNAIAGRDPRDASSSREPVKDYLPPDRPDLAGVRIGLPENFYFERVDPAVEAAVKEMARRAEPLGARVVPVRVPDIAALNAVGRLILLAEASALLEPFLDRRADFGADVLALLDQGRLIPATDYVNAQRLRSLFIEEFRALWKQVDCLFTPATPAAAPLIGQTTVRFGQAEEDVRLAATRLVRGINVIGAPALAMPCGFDAGGLPLGLQIVGRPFDEDLILRVGAALQDVTDFHVRTPPGLQSSYWRQSMDLSRRSFIQGATAVAAAPQVRGANDRIQVGVIGTGARSHELMQALMTLPGAEIVAVVDAYKGRLERAIERTNGRARPCRDYREILADKSIDAVLVVTPDHWHKTLVLEAFQAGKDVYCEKPLTYRSAEGVEIASAARKTGRILQVGSQGVSSAVQRKAKEMISAGKLGRITLIRAAYNRNTASGAWIYPIPPDASPETVNWEMFLGPAPRRPFSLERFFRWRCYQEYSGGIATDLFVHLCTTIHFLMDAVVPAKAIALGELYRWKESRDVPDTINAVLEYREGFAVNLSSTFNNQTSAEGSFQILGTEGSLALGGGLTFYPERAVEDNRWIVESWPKRLEDAYYKDPKVRAAELVNLRKPKVLEGVQQFQTEGLDATVSHLGHFLDSIRTRKPYWEDASAGHHAAACAHMVNLSASAQRLVEWDFSRDDIKTA